MLCDGGACGLLLQRGPSGLDFLLVRNAANAPFEEQIRILSALLKEVFKREKNNTFKTFFIGRLINAFGSQNTQMSERLATAAYESDLWNNGKGRPLSGHENSFLQNLSNTFHIFPELSRAFFEHGFFIQVSGIEKVFIDRVERLPFAESLRAKGVEGSARLPYDCLTWFSISEAAAGVHLGGGYWKDERGVYWRSRQKKHFPKGEPIKYIEKKLAGADPASFVFLAERVEGLWGKDKNGIYFFYEKMKGVDINTWEPLDMGYSKDKNFVYNGSEKLEGADPKTFEIPFEDWEGETTDDECLPEESGDML